MYPTLNLWIWSKGILKLCEELKSLFDMRFHSVKRLMYRT